MTSQPICSLERSVAPYFLGIDVGGTGIKIGLLDDQGQTLGFTAIDTLEARGPVDAMQRVAQASEKLLDSVGISKNSVVRAGLGTPGSQDIPNGLLIEPPNHPHWHHFPIVECLKNELGLPVSFANDANAAAFGEFWIGTGKTHSSLVLITLGTGVGGGIIIDGQLIVGHNSFGGECGHMLIDPSPNARLCVWGGGQGQLEAYASASALVERAKESLHSGAKSLLSDEIEGLTAKRIFEAAELGDDWSLKIIEETADYLAVGITSLVHILDPGLVVLGGAMNFGGPKHKTGRRFLDKVRQGFEERTFQYVKAGTIIEFANLGADAGYIGAAGIARSDYHKTL
ncbi:MAG: Glucokinase [Planctomycetota bacterium]